jgi:glycosyltransferase involved in cell wall biosynthesis
MKTLILEQFPELESRVDVAYCTPRHFSSIQCGICAGCDFLASERSLGDYFISVGTIEPRKNYPFLLENWLVFREIDEADCSLLIIGKKGWKSNKLVKALVKFGSIESNNLIWIDTCCDGSLSQFYKGAKSFISTSFDEGFNLPALEARSVYSLPLLLSDISVHRELHSGYANFFRTASEFVNVITESNSIILNGDRGFESSSKSIVEIIAERTKIYL